MKTHNRVGPRPKPNRAKRARNAKPKAGGDRQARFEGTLLKITDQILANSARRKRPALRTEKAGFDPFRPAIEEYGLHPPRVKAAKGQIAMDAAVSDSLAWAWATAPFAEGIGFLGYAYLALLTQRPEYRRISERIATEMTRKWIKLTSVGDDDKTDKVKHLGDALKRLEVQALFRKMAELDGFFGRAHIFVDCCDRDNRNELKTPIGDGRDELSRKKIAKGSLKRFQAVEPVWCYPSNYNANDPLSPDWYRPSMWVVQGKEVHVSRLITFVGREVPDLLKPAYSFGGLSLSQMAKPYVDNWLETRQSVNDIISAFSVFVLKTDMTEGLQSNAEQMFARADLFNNLRNNRGLMMIDKTLEDFANVSAPLGTLDLLQAQAQEHMAAVSGIPLVILLGIQPAGLNASSEGEIRTFYDWIHAFQEGFFTTNLTKVIDLVQLNEFGEVDPEITFSYEPLWAMSEKEKAETEKIKAETDGILIDNGELDPMEGRQRLASDPDSEYASIDVEEMPAPPAPGKLDENDEDDEVADPDAIAAGA